MVKSNESNICGILGICLGWVIPLLGIILGIVSLARREKSPAFGVIAIIEGIIFWVLGIAAIMTLYALF